VYRYTEEPSVRVNNPHVLTETTYTPRSSASASAAAAAVDSTGDNDDVWCKVCKSLRRDLSIKWGLSAKKLAGE